MTAFGNVQKTTATSGTLHIAGAGYVYVADSIFAGNTRNGTNSREIYNSGTMTKSMLVRSIFDVAAETARQTAFTTEANNVYSASAASIFGTATPTLSNSDANSSWRVQTLAVTSALLTNYYNDLTSNGTAFWHFAVGYSDLISQSRFFYQMSEDGSTWNEWIGPRDYSTTKATLLDGDGFTLHGGTTDARGYYRAKAESQTGNWLITPGAYQLDGSALMVGTENDVWASGNKFYKETELANAVSAVTAGQNIYVANVNLTYSETLTIATGTSVNFVGTGDFSALTKTESTYAFIVKGNAELSLYGLQLSSSDKAFVSVQMNETTTGAKVAFINSDYTGKGTGRLISMDTGTALSGFTIKNSTVSSFSGYAATITGTEDAVITLDNAEFIFTPLKSNGIIQATTGEYFNLNDVSVRGTVLAAGQKEVVGTASQNIVTVTDVTNVLSDGFTVARQSSVTGNLMTVTGVTNAALKNWELDSVTATGSILSLTIVSSVTSLTAGAGVSLTDSTFANLKTTGAAMFTFGGTGTFTLSDLTGSELNADSYAVFDFSTAIRTNAVLNVTDSTFSDVSAASFLTFAGEVLTISGLELSYFTGASTTLAPINVAPLSVAYADSIDTYETDVAGYNEKLAAYDAALQAYNDALLIFTATPTSENLTAATTAWGNVETAKTA